MSRHTPPTNALSNGFGGTKAATLQDASGLFQTLQGHVDDIRGLLQCGICIRPLYEPFTLACGHTFCYGCLTSWFTEGRNNKTCPDCRALVKSQPAPAYLVRAVVQLFTSRAELLDKGETTDQHVAHQSEEAGRIETDKRNTNPNDGGLFKGIFSKARHHPSAPIIDLEDGVVRCPHCSWELEEAGCVNCGYRHDDDSMSDTDYSEENSEMTDDPYAEGDEEIDDDFGDPIDLEAWDDGTLMAAGLHAIPHQGHTFGMPRAMPRAFHPARGVVGLDPYGPAHPDEDEDEEEEDEDEDMDSFIDDGEPTDYGSESGRSTIVGHPDYSREQLHAIFDSPPPGYAHHLIFAPHGVPDSEEDSEDHEIGHEDEDEDESETSSDSEDEEEAVDTFGEEDDVEDDEDEDEDEESIRPATAGNRQRIPTYTILSSSSPLRANGTAAANAANNGACPRTQAPAGSSTNHAIALDDDDDDDSDEGPVAPTRRGRDRGGIRS
ncbi:hypothetical protein BDV06DRAFT_186106 [Aspergillus oleicola]